MDPSGHETPEGAPLQVMAVAVAVEMTVAAYDGCAADHPGHPPNLAMRPRGL